MKLLPQTNTLKGLVFHIAIALVLIFVLCIIFFYKLLPAMTNRNKVVTVPELKGMTMAEAREFLFERELDFEVTDSSYNSLLPPYTVLEQYPKASAKVKVHRKINLKLNAARAPVVLYPDLSGATLDFAKKQLDLLELRVSSVEYRRDIAHGAILESKISGHIVQAGDRVSKGSKVDLIIGFSE